MVEKKTDGKLREGVTGALASGYVTSKLRDISYKIPLSPSTVSQDLTAGGLKDIVKDFSKKNNVKIVYTDVADSARRSSILNPKYYKTVLGFSRHPSKISRGSIQEALKRKGFVANLPRNEAIALHELGHINAIKNSNFISEPSSRTKFIRKAPGLAAATLLSGRVRDSIRKIDLGVGAGSKAMDFVDKHPYISAAAILGAPKLFSEGRATAYALGELTKRHGLKKGLSKGAILAPGFATYVRGALGQSVGLGTGLKLSKAYEDSKTASEMLDEMYKTVALSKQADDDAENATRGVVGTAGAGLIYSGTKEGIQKTKEMVEKGHITGRETLYHNTQTKNVESILRDGIKASKAADPNNLTNTVLKDIPAESLANKVYFAKRKTLADDIGRGRTHLLGDSGNTTLKARVPVWKLKQVDNPEMRGAKSALEFHEIIEKKMPGAQKVLTPERIREAKNTNTFNNLSRKGTSVFEGDIGSEIFKKGKNHKLLDIPEMTSFIKNNPKRFAKGVAPIVAGTAAVGAGAYLVSKALKKTEKTAHEQLDEMYKTAWLIKDKERGLYDSSYKATDKLIASNPEVSKQDIYRAIHKEWNNHPLKEKAVDEFMIGNKGIKDRFSQRSKLRAASGSVLQIDKDIALKIKNLKNSDDIAGFVKG